MEQEIKDIQTMISTQFADYKHLPYRLYAVFVHHGSVEFGHYYIYIYDFKKGIWRKYNDDVVTEVKNTAEIFESQGRQNPPTPYFLVYVNDAIKDRLVDPVCRDVVEVPPATVEGGVGLTMNTSTTMDGVTTAAAPEDVDMDPPSYYEAWTDGGPAGTRDGPNPDDEKGSAYMGGNAAAGSWISNYDADMRDVQW